VRSLAGLDDRLNGGVVDGRMDWDMVHGTWIPEDVRIKQAHQEEESVETMYGINKRNHAR